MTLFTAFVIALKFAAGISLVVSFLGSFIILLWVFLEADYPDKIRIPVGIPLILLWLTMLVYCLGNAESWFDRPWFQPNPPANVMVITPEKL